MKFVDLAPETTTACWSTAASMGPEPALAQIRAIQNGDLERAREIAKELTWTRESIAPIVADADLFASYNIQLEKTRIGMAGYCKAGSAASAVQRVPARISAAVPRERDALARRCARSTRRSPLRDLVRSGRDRGSQRRTRGARPERLGGVLSGYVAARRSRAHGVGRVFARRRSRTPRAGDSRRAGRSVSCASISPRPIAPRSTRCTIRCWACRCRSFTRRATWTSRAAATRSRSPITKAASSGSWPACPRTPTSITRPIGRERSATSSSTPRRRAAARRSSARSSVSVCAIRPAARTSSAATPTITAWRSAASAARRSTTSPSKSPTSTGRCGRPAA